MRIADQLRGPAPAWPAPLDALLEGWARVPARGRALLGGAALVVVVVAAGGGLLEGPWGPAVPVLVTRTAVAGGASLLPGDLEVARRPRDALPEGALRAGGLPERAVAAGPLPPGAVLSATQVVGGGPSARVAPGRGLVPVPVEQLPALPPGTRARVVAAGTDGAATTVATRAEVVAADATHVWLEVDLDDVAGVAAAVARGGVVLGVVP